MTTDHFLNSTGSSSLTRVAAASAGSRHGPHRLGVRREAPRTSAEVGGVAGRHRKELSEQPYDEYQGGEQLLP